MQQVRGDGDEDGSRRGESVSRGIGDRGFGVMASTRDADVACGENQRSAERDGLEVLHVHGTGHGEEAAGSIGLAHGLVEEGRNDASVRVAWRTGEAAGEAKAADDVLVGVGEESEPET